MALLNGKRSQSPKAKEDPIGAHERMAGVSTASARVDSQRPKEIGDYSGRVDTATRMSSVQRSEERIHSMGGEMSGGEEADDGGATETDCEDPDSAYVIEMERIWAEAEAWVDAEAQVE